MSNIDRKLATLRKVSELHSIEGADFIEIAKVDGWQCVVKKGEFKVGDIGIYFEIDSVLPEGDSRFEFIKDTKQFKGVTRKVLRTAKFKKQLSQGLLLPVTQFPEVLTVSKFFGLSKSIYTPEYAYEKQLVLDKILGIEKYEKEEPVTEPSWMKKTSFIPKSWKTWFFNQIYRKIKRGPKQSTFPNFIPRTDEDRIQNCYNRVIKNPDAEYEVSVKLDGSSMTFWSKDEKFGFASRNQTLGIGCGNNFEAVVKRHELERKFPAYCLVVGRNLAFQGELLGPGIQGNFEKQDNFNFFLFNIWDIDQKRKLTPRERVEMLTHYNTLTSSTIRHTPILGTFTLGQFSNLATLLLSAEGKGLDVPKREGVVWKRMDGEESFKVISNSYLLSKKD